MKEILSHSIADTAKFAQEFLAGLFPCADSSTVVGLYGDLGSGKTAFVQQIAKALGARGSVQSPTFVIMKKYALKNPPSLPPLLKGGEGGLNTWGCLLIIFSCIFLITSFISNSPISFEIWA